MWWELPGIFFLVSEMDVNVFVALVATFLMIVMALSWPVFLFYSVRRIEKGIVAEGKPRPCQWDPVGLRAFYYAWTVSLPASVVKRFHSGLLDIELVRRYANKPDVWFGSFLNISAHLMVLMLLVNWMLGNG